MIAFSLMVPLWALVLASIGCLFGLIVAWVIGVILVSFSGDWPRTILCGVYATASGTALGLALGWIIAEISTLWWAIVPLALVAFCLTWGLLRLFAGKKTRY